MTGQPPPTQPPKPCRACGREVPQQAQTCAHCGETQAPRDASTQTGLRPLGGEPVGPPRERPAPPPPRPSAPRPPASSRPTGKSKQPAGSQPRRGDLTLWEFVQDQWRADRWFAVLLALIALNALLSFLHGDLFGLIVSGVVLWGLLSYNYWVYIIMVIVVGISVVSGGLLLITGQASLGSLPGLALNAFILGVLLNRHERYM